MAFPLLALLGLVPSLFEAGGGIAGAAFAWIGKDAALRGSGSFFSPAWGMAGLAIAARALICVGDVSHKRGWIC